MGVKNGTIRCENAIENSIGIILVIYIRFPVRIKTLFDPLGKVTVLTTLMLGHLF